MIHFSWAAIEATGSALAAIYPVFIGIRHFLGSFRKKREAHREAILKQARDEMGKIKRDLEDKIQVLRDDLDTQKDKVSTELSHMKEIYGAEIRVLGEKIENLREDIQVQHQSLVALLTKLVDVK